MRLGRLLRNTAEGLKSPLTGMAAATLLGAGVGAGTAYASGSSMSEGAMIGAGAGAAMGLAGAVRQGVMKRTGMNSLMNDIKANRGTLIRGGIGSSISNIVPRLSHGSMASKYRTMAGTRVGVGAMGYAGAAIAAGGMSYAMLPSNRNSRPVRR